MTAPKEIVPGLWHWTTIHPEIKVHVHSYLAEKEKLLIDPLLPSPGGMAWLRKRGPPEHIVLTSGFHSRHSAKIAAALGCTVWCPRKGLRRLAPELTASARPYDPGDKLPGGARAMAVGVICPDESAVLLPRLRALAVADGVVRWGKGAALGFVPDDLLVDDPKDAPEVKRGLKKAYRKLAREKWDHLLMAHGAPWLGDGREALRAFAEAP